MGNSKIKCEYCEKEYSTTSVYFRHIRKQAGTGEHPTAESEEFKTKFGPKFKPKSKSEEERVERRAEAQRRHYERTRAERIRKAREAYEAECTRRRIAYERVLYAMDTLR